MNIPKPINPKLPIILDRIIKLLLIFTITWVLISIVRVHVDNHVVLENQKNIHLELSTIRSNQIALIQNQSLITFNKTQLEENRDMIKQIKEAVASTPTNFFE